MIIYFADRQLSIIGQASTNLPKGLKFKDDLKSEDVETGVAIFECKICFDAKTRALVELCTEVGNNILLCDKDENKLFTIIDSELDTETQEVYIYTEDGGMDLLNEVFGEYEADKAYPIDHYITKYASGAGFTIGVNEAASLTRKLKWDGEATAAERIASAATQFDGCEVSYSFEVDGLSVTRKFINIHRKRGKDIGTPLRLNKDIRKIIIEKSVGNLATALQCKGGIPEEAEDPITLDGYKYDDGDFYVDGKVLKSRVALKRWNRYLWKNAESEQAGGHIVRQYSYDTTNKGTLCAHAITELKKLRDIAVNYKAEIVKLPENTRVGDRISIVDDAGELYLSTRILKLEGSVSDDTYKATLGEFLIKDSGISERVASLAAQFASTSKSAARASVLADNALNAANVAQSQAATASETAEQALSRAEESTEAVESAKQSAAQAQAAAENAQALVDNVDNKISGIESTVNEAKASADNAQLAATTAETKADEAAQSATKAIADAADAKAQSELAQSAATTASEKADTAKSTAETAKADAETAQATAEAAKADAQKAKTDIDSLAERVETVSNTMQADYARKTDLTEASASLQSQISQNATQISSTVSRMETIDETANTAKEQAQAAQNVADTAKAQAEQAISDAEAAQTAADSAAQAAAAAQSEANTAKAAAATAQSVADKAETDLAKAKADLETVSSRVDATEEDIVAAQAAVQAAQTAADKAKSDAQTATETAAEAQSKADTAVSNAQNAQTVANDASSKATLAQKVADEAKGDASSAIATANQAASVAAEAQNVANNARTTASNAQAVADQAVADAASAQEAADAAGNKADQAAADLATAKQNLADVTSRVGATEEEVEVAQAAVSAAQSAADRAQEEAEAAQSTANTAKANAATAQTAANNAKTAADNAQTAADEAQQAAAEAQAAVDSLAVRVTDAETQITQNANEIALRAKKTEVTEALGGYYTKEQTDSAIRVKADEINLNVSSTYATKNQVENIDVGSRNHLRNSADLVFRDYYFDTGLMLTDDGSGNVTAYGITAEDDNAGNVVAYNLALTDDGEGNVTAYSTGEPTVTKEMKSLIVGDTKYNVVDKDAVRFTSQSLTDSQKSQARSNIGAATLSEAQNAANSAITQAKKTGELLSNVTSYTAQNVVDSTRLVGISKTSLQQIVQQSSPASTILVKGNESAVEHIRISNANGYANKIGIEVQYPAQRLSFYDIYIVDNYAIGVKIPTAYYSQFAACWIQGDVGIAIGDEANQAGWIGVLDFNSCHFNNSGVAFIVYAKDTNTICLDKCSFEGDTIAIDNYGTLYVRNTYFGDQVETTDPIGVLIARPGSKTYFENGTIGISSFANGGRSSIFDLRSDSVDGASIVTVSGGMLGLSNNFNRANSQSSIYAADSKDCIIYLDFVSMVQPASNAYHNRAPYYIYDGYSPLRSKYPLKNYVSNGTMRSALGNAMMLNHSTASGLTIDASMVNPFGGSVLRANGMVKFFYKVPRHLVGQKMVLEVYAYTPTTTNALLSCDTLGVSFTAFMHGYEDERRPAMYRVECVPTSETGCISFSQLADFNVYGMVLKEFRYKDFLSCYEDISELVSDSAPTTTVGAVFGDTVENVDNGYGWRFDGKSWVSSAPLTYTIAAQGKIVQLIGSDGSMSEAALVETKPVQYKLTSCTSSNIATSAVLDGEYTTTLAPIEDYGINSVTVTMNDVDVTADVYDSATQTIYIPVVTGRIVITAVAVYVPFVYIVPDMIVAPRSAWYFDAPTGVIDLQPSNTDLSIGVSTANDYAFTDRESKATYIMPVPAKASKVTVDIADGVTYKYKFETLKLNSGVLTRVDRSNSWTTENTFSFVAGAADYILIWAETVALTSVPWGYDDSKVTVTFESQE